MSTKFNDVFVANRIYPDAKDVFSVSLKPLSAVKNNCVFVVDTNALLLPYLASQKSINEIKKVYSLLISQGRLVVPGQVAREFANNRPEKIKELFQQLNRKKNKVSFGAVYPLLSDNGDYKEVIEVEEQINDLFKEYIKKVNKVIDGIKSWTWNDPVSEVYSELFNENVVVDLVMEEEVVKKELERRYLHKIPPGYKDGGKDDDGIGDLLIWLTILDIAEKRNVDVVFVSGEEKTDWYHRSEGQTLYPRFELISEFRKKTNGNSFHIMKLSELLDMFSADKTAVKEVEVEENSSDDIEFHNLSFVDTSISDTMRRYSEKTTKQISVIERKLSFKIAKDWAMNNFSRFFQASGRGSEFPDLIFFNPDEKIGVEIKLLTKRSSISMMVNDVFSKAYYEVSRNNFNKIILIIAFVGEEDELYSAYNRFVHEVERRKPDNHFFEMIFGQVDVSGSFFKVLHI
ncbi:PIN domain-containing protein [Hymenobacter sp. B81]|uniref:PIN domain-containing protein n=1 Tax=Hymenobacter sp. B81 TaxID=3344878 RepID=UPI0037DCD6FF